MLDIYGLISQEDLTEDLKDLADVIGIENVRKLLKSYSGAQFYIPKITRLDSFVHNYLSSNKSKDTKKLAYELSCSEQYVRNKRKELRSLINDKPNQLI